MCERSASPYHLLLDTGALSTTNVKMKKLHTILGLLIIGFLTQNGLAKSQTTSTKRIQRQAAYLPPHSSRGSPQISEEYITIHEESPGNQGKFQESNYGDGKYQIFEIHRPTTTQQQSTRLNGPEYLPPQQNIQTQHVNRVQGTSGNHHQAPVQEEIIRVEHIHVFKSPNTVQPNSFNAPDYLPPHQGQQQNNQQIFQQPIQQQTNAYKGQDYLPPHQEHQSYHIQPQPNNYNGPDYLPPHQEHQIHQQEVQHQIHQQQNNYKGPDYLPPHHEHQSHHQEIQIQQQPNSYKGPDYLPPHQGQQIQQQDVQHQIHQQQNNYKGPDYLPPHQEHQTHQQVVQHQVHQQQNKYKGPDYLPPHQEQQIHQQEVQYQTHQQQNNYKGPDYLPPHQEHQNHHQEIPIQHQQQPNSYRGPDYLPPHQEHQIHQQQNNYKGPDYLPPHQEHQTYKGPDYLPPLQQAQVQNPVQQQPGPEYLPPQQNQQQFQHHSNAYKGPDYLPPHQNSQPQQSSPQFKGPDYLPPHQSNNLPHPGSLPSGYEPQIPAVPSVTTHQNPLPQAAPQHIVPSVPSNLPPGYDFEKPENAEQAIAELHTLPDEGPNQKEVIVQSQIQVAQNPQQGEIIYGSHISGVNYQTKGYLPPTNCQAQQGNVQQAVPQTGVQQVTPQVFNHPQTAPVAAAPAPAPAYLPATPVQAHHYSSNNLHSLSSFMSSVQPFQRYASSPRQPFREYGPPKSTPDLGTISQQQQPQPQQQHIQPIPITAMYNEQASRSPYYAPTMSYATKSVANSYTTINNDHTTQHQQNNLNHQTRQNLQQFMPQDVRQSHSVHYAATAANSAAAVPVRQSTTSKIRTVQIVNPAAVKTLKVLETSDHTGVKTIKILGPSNTQPTGEHHVVKVVTQNAPNAHEHVQTVKIFDSHEDVTNRGVTTANANAYLPPNARSRRQFTGRRRYRF